MVNLVLTNEELIPIVSHHSVLECLYMLLSEFKFAKRRRKGVN